MLIPSSKRVTTAPSYFGLGFVSFTADLRLAYINEAAQDVFNQHTPPPIDGEFLKKETRSVSDFLAPAFANQAALEGLASKSAKLKFGDTVRICVQTRGEQGRPAQRWCDALVECVSDNQDEEQEAVYSILLIRESTTTPDDSAALDSTAALPPTPRQSQSPEPRPNKPTNGTNGVHHSSQPSDKFALRYQHVAPQTTATLPPVHLNRESLIRAHEQMDAEVMSWLLEAMPVMALTLAPDGQIIWASGEWYRYTGLETRSGGTGAWLDLHIPEELAEIIPMVETACAAGDDLRFEFRLRRADGQFRWHVCQSRATIDEATGQVLAYCVSVFDVEELVQARLQSSVLQRHIGSFLTVSKAVLVSIDRNHKITSFEGRPSVARSILRPTNSRRVPDDSDVVIGASLDSLWDDPRLKQGIQRVLNAEVTRLILTLDDSDKRWSRFALVRLTEQDESSDSESEATAKDVIGVVLVASDITAEVETKQALEAAHREQTRLEASESAAQEASALKTAFLQLVLHEVRTPLTAITTICELLSDDTTLAEGHRSLINQALRSSEILHELVGRVLDVRRIETNELKLEEAPFELQSIVDDARLFSITAHKKGIYFKEDIGEFYSGSLLGDRLRIRQIIANALSNSTKFCSSGGITFRMKQEDETAQKVGLVFVIEDTGCGIAEDVLPTLFQPFRQADASVCRQYGGSGLGLVIAKNLAELMGGSVVLESTLDVGSTFTVRIPFKKATTADNAAASPVPLALEPGRDGRPEKSAVRLLLAEDNDIIRDVVVRTLHKMKFENVDAVSDGREAVKAAHENHYDVILMDKEMPKLDGCSAARALRASTADNVRDVKIIALTASAIEGDLEKCRSAGMDHYLSKPVRAKDLERAIWEVLTPTTTPPTTPSVSK